MKYFNFLILTLIFFIPGIVLAGGVNTGLDILSSDTRDNEVYAYYDLRERNSYIQVTNISDFLNPLCIHVQIFQQDQGCSELDFNDELTPNDTVVYDLDNLIRNNGSEVPVNLDDNSYGFVAISSYDCNDIQGDTDEPLIGNFRIVDDSGYEYRMNLVSGEREQEVPGQIGARFLVRDQTTAFANVIIPFDTVDGATHADLVAFVVNDNRLLSCVDGADNDLDLVCNDPAGATFSVFQIDENEERLSCDQVNFACGPGKVMNYGLNEDYPNSKGGPILCNGAGLNSGQTNGYFSLENVSYVSEIPPGRASEFVCIIGLNNGNGTGSMDSCQFKCIDGNNDCDD